MNYFEKRFNKGNIVSNEEKYDFWRYEGDLGVKLDNLEVEFIANTIIKTNNKNKSKVRIFDLGCGTGYHLINTVKQFKNIFDIRGLGIDRNEAYALQAKNNIVINGLDNKVEVNSESIEHLNSSYFEKHFLKSTHNLVLAIGVCQYLTYEELEMLSESLSNINGYIIIKHPINYSHKIIKEETREGFDYRSDYKNFENIYAPFSKNFDFVSMEKCFPRNYFEKDVYDSIESKEGIEQFFIVLCSKNLSLN